MLPKPCAPRHPHFSSGPTNKFPGWTLGSLNESLMSCSHRSAQGISKIQQLMDQVRQLVDLPQQFFIALTPGSACGAFEMLLWNLLGYVPVDCLVHDVFSMRWCQDIKQQLKLNGTTVVHAPIGHLPDLMDINFDHDVVLNWNGTTSGVRFPSSNFIPDNRKGLVIADLTSALFCESFDWHKFDAVAFSWQKGLGSEAAHGMVFINERVTQRLLSYQPSWPIPYIFSFKKNGVINWDLFKGKTLNTPSLLCIEDFIQALGWAQEQGGQSFLSRQTQSNFIAFNNWLKQQEWCKALAADPSTQSYSTHCILMTEPWFTQLSTSQQWQIIEDVIKLLRNENMVYDCMNHQLSLPSFRLWGGPTIQSDDLIKALNCLKWAYMQIRHDLRIS